MVAWKQPTNLPLPKELVSFFDGNEALASILYRRGIKNVEEAQTFLFPEQFPSPPFHPLLDVDRACERLLTAIQKREGILIWGDFDVDGIASTALLLERLRALNAKVTFHISQSGHGVSISELRRVLPGNQLLITCDTGLNSPHAVQFALDRGVEVILTDHHPLVSDVPNPASFKMCTSNLPEEDYYKPLCGVGVVYSWMQVLEKRLKKDPSWKPNNDWVALGTIADQGELLRANRLYVREGLRTIQSATRASLLALFGQIGLEAEGVNEDHLNDQVIPRLHTYGRFKGGATLVEFLLSQEIGFLREVASDIEGFYAKQKMLIRQVHQSALKLLESQPNWERFGVIFLVNPHWPREVLGMIASRMAEDYGKPVFMVTASMPDEFSGTARSPQNVDLLTVFHSAKHLVVEHYGHTHAVGFRVRAERLQDLHHHLISTLAGTLSEAREVLEVDGRLQMGKLSPELLIHLERLAPFGRGNPAPKFLHEKAYVQKATPIGRHKAGVSWSVKDEEGNVHRVVRWFGYGEVATIEMPPGEIDLVYSVRRRDYRGRNRLELICEAFRPSADQSVESGRKIAVKVLDWRNEGQLISRINALAGDVSLWAEGDWARDLPEKLFRWKAFTRKDLPLCETLVILTAPPDRQTLQAVLNKCMPHLVVLCALDPHVDGFQDFLQRFVGILKFTMNNRGGIGSCTEFASAMAHRQETVRYSLHWLDEINVIRILQWRDDEFHIESGAIAAKSIAAPQRLMQMLSEARAYRAFYRRAEVADLLPHDWIIATD